MRAVTEGQGAGNGLGKTKAQAKAHGHTRVSLRIGAFQAEIAPTHGEASVDGFAHAAPAAPECVGRFVAVEREPAVGLVGGVELDLDGDGSGQQAIADFGQQLTAQVVGAAALEESRRDKGRDARPDTRWAQGVELSVEVVARAGEGDGEEEIGQVLGPGAAGVADDLECRLVKAFLCV